MYGFIEDDTALRMFISERLMKMRALRVSAAGQLMARTEYRIAIIMARHRYSGLMH